MLEDNYNAIENLAEIVMSSNKNLVTCQSINLLGNLTDH